jgi:predicted transcriptional regulator of viral defense system
MKFEDLLEIVGDEPVFETGLLLAGEAEAADVHRQLSRWQRSGRLVQLRRGWYALAPPFRRVQPHPFLAANRIVPGSYVSCQSALAFHGLIPEAVLTVTSVTAGRPGRWVTPLGTFDYRHVRQRLLWGFQRVPVSQGQEAFVAGPEKALLDLVYLEPVGDSTAYLAELRLQNLDRLDLEELATEARRFGKPKLERAAQGVTELARAETLEYVVL